MEFVKQTKAVSVPVVVDIKAKIKKDLVQGIAQKIVKRTVSQANKKTRAFLMSTSTPSTSAGNSSNSVQITAVHTPPQLNRKRMSGPQQCPVCGSLEKNQKHLNLHIKQTHPGYTFPCSVCNKKFTSFNSRYKHEVEHSAFRFFLPVL